MTLLWLPITGYGASGSGLYEIEVLVFKHLQEELEGDELWTSKFSTDTDTTEIADTLMHTTKYEIMLHKRWVQNADAKSKAKALALNTGKNKKQADVQLAGELRFYLRRFYHLDVNLSMLEGAEKLLPYRPGSEAEQIVYTIKQDRRIKTKEINYFDHPKFGMLVIVRPLRRS